MKQTYDVVVIGGGAAGLSGAVALGRARRSVLVIDSGQPRNARAGHVHNFLTRDGTPPAQLLSIGRDEVTRYGGEIVSATVHSVRRDGQDFQVELDNTHLVTAKRLLVATGLVDDLPEIAGLAKRFGRDVLHCPYCHGWEVRDQRIGVLATGPLSAHQANLWRQWSSHIVLITHHSSAPTGADAAQLAAREISIVDGPVAALEVAADVLTGVRLSSGEVVALDALVIAAPARARVDALAELGLKPVDVEMGGHVVGSQIAADPTGATAVAGVWVAGNVADVRAQVLSSAAAGLAAGAAINADLIAQETRAAIER